MRVLIAVDLNDNDLSVAYDQPAGTIGAGSEWDDLCVSLDARLSEAGYFGRDDYPVRGHVVAAADFSGPYALRDLLDSAEIGAVGIGDGLNDAEDEGRLLHVTGSLLTFRQHAAAQGAI